MRFLVQGGKTLHGEVTVQGAKNAAMKMIAAALLGNSVSVLKNVPDITDIATLIAIVEKLGVKVAWTHAHELTIDPRGMKNVPLDEQLVGKMRGAIVLVGPLLARFGQVRFTQPGGDLIGARPIDIHLRAFEQLGASVTHEGRWITLVAKKLKSGVITLSEMSVTATENALLAAALIPGTTEIRACAMEPEIEDLARFLEAMGAQIKGAGTPTITVIGAQTLRGGNHTVIPDRIEAGTFAIAALVTQSAVTIRDIVPLHLAVFLEKLREAGALFTLQPTVGNRADMILAPSPHLRAVIIKTHPYPGFPTDLQAPFALLLTQAQGTSRIFETLYEGRLKYLHELSRMGANVKIIGAHEAFVTGPTPLKAKKITTLDIRTGATLVLAALAAKGQSSIERAELINRGYEAFDERLRALGAHIERKRT